MQRCISRRLPEGLGSGEDAEALKRKTSEVLKTSEVWVVLVAGYLFVNT